MKRFVFVAIIAICLFGFAYGAFSAPATVAKGPDNEKALKKTTLRFAYFHWKNVSGSADFNDVNTPFVESIYGTLLDYWIESAGTDANFAVRFYIDLPEPGETASTALTLLKSQDCNTIDSNTYYYAFTTVDPSANVFGGIPLAGLLYCGINDANDVNSTLSDPSTNLTDLKVWVIYDEKAPATK